MPYLEQLRFHLVGYGCTTCIGNSGPLPATISHGYRGRQSRRRRRVERQSQFRGPRSSRSARQLSRLAAAGRRLRPGRPGGHRPAQRTARHRQRRQACLSQGHLAHAARKSSDAIAKSVHSEMFTQGIRRSVPGRRDTGNRCRCRRAICSPGTQVHLRQASAVFRGHEAATGAGDGHQGRPRVGGAGRQHHDRSHFAGRLDQEGRPGRASI